MFTIANQSCLRITLLTDIILNVLLSWYRSIIQNWNYPIDILDQSKYRYSARHFHQSHLVELREHVGHVVLVVSADPKYRSLIIARSVMVTKDEWKTRSKRLSKKGRNWTELSEVGWRRQKLDGTVPTRIELRAVARLQNKTRQVSSAEGASR